ncbi:MAG: hypothetical protein LQ351_005281 [Letrouitia transgressa]|nr:MAG: hypothetical protein LQ351_005281 [Letrouitia transgressa]
MEDQISVTFLHHGTSHTFSFPSASTIADLSSQIQADLSIPPDHQKFMITPKIGILKTPFPDPMLPLSSLTTKKIVLLAPLPSELKSLSNASATSSRPRPPPLKSTTPTRHRDWRRTQEEATYSFGTIIPLPYLPKPERSRRFLERLRDDAGIKASMRKHKFSVGVLTEMNPAEHTTHESRTLGLNRNRGEVIELRLRTDSYDGYRDYKVIRNTLCHELAHNVYGEHDRDFWDLTKDIEKEVERNDWRGGGHALTDEEFYNPEDTGLDKHIDGGGWTGGEFMLGGKEMASKTTAEGTTHNLSRREILAKAAEERMKKQNEIKRSGGDGRTGS